MLTSTIGDFMYAENADMYYMYGRANGNGSAAQRIECIKRSFLIDEAVIVNLVKHVRSVSPDMMLVNEETYAVQAWKKAS
ncbi:hypothetical protein TNCV_1330021 [Trichonephila clavipes]|uniref:Uncharacterized protein n=1 Tax=Trichonephila clavipes TaxID=2585209 RepID=A0A8X6UX87_TRICX|nr:hypothetical protein TNCV_1330021 [Trichonephila clavipes]